MTVKHIRLYSGKLGPWARYGAKGKRYLDVGYQGQPDYRLIESVEKDGDNWRYLRVQVAGISDTLVRWCSCNIYE